MEKKMALIKEGNYLKGKRADEMNEVQMERKRALMEEGSTDGKEEGTDERRKCRWKGRGH